MSRIRVAHVIGSAGFYGAEEWVLTLLAHLPAARVTATVINLCDTARGTSEIVRVARERGISAMDIYTGGRFNPAAIVKMARLARQSRCHVLHSHGYKADLTCLVAARLTGARAISTPHGWSREPDRRLAMYESLDRRLLRGFDTVCPLSPELRTGLRRSGVPERKLRMVLNGVDIDRIDAIAPAGITRQRGTLIGYVGQLIARKNVECLIQAFDRLGAHRDDLRLMIVGDGPRADTLRALSQASGRVEFMGYRDDALALMKTFDVIVLPSREEGIPRCLMEAMAARVPVVASDIPGNRDLVDPGVTGVLFHPDHPDQLAEAIAHVIEAPERAKDMAREARSLVETRFSARRMAEEYAALYEQC